MKELRVFFEDFVKNKGLFVATALLVSKFLTFLTQIILIRLLTKEEYGSLVYLLSFLIFFIPITGLGSYQGLLRFGALSEDTATKNQLYSYAFFQSLIFQIILSFVFAGILYYNISDYSFFNFIVILLIIRLFSYYYINLLFSYLRIINENEKFSQANILLNLSTFVFVLISAYFFGFLGSLTAFCLAPLTLLIYLKKSHFANFKFLKLDKKFFWSFSIYSTIAYLLGELMLFFDVYIIEYFLNKEAVADYKVLILLPTNLMLFPQIFLQTDFPKLSFYHKNKSYLNAYIKNYLMIFITFSLLSLLFLYFSNDFLIKFIFGENYQGGFLFMILTFFVLIFCCFGVLYSNFLSAIGKENYNSITTLVSLVLFVIFATYLVPILGISGMIYSLGIYFVISSISKILFYYFAVNQSNN